MPRPTDYSEELCIEIAARSAEGQSLKTICEADDMPSLRSVLRWRHVHPEFDQLLMRAHLDKADILFEESVSIADEPVADTAQAMRNKLRVQARQYAAARLNPTRYAERIAVGAAPEFPATETLSDFDAARRVAYILQRNLHRLRNERQRIGPALALVHDNADTSGN